MNHNILKTSIRLRQPSFMKGASRLMDLYGRLDEYKLDKNVDFRAMKSDWQVVGEDLFVAIDKYEQKVAK